MKVRYFGPYKRSELPKAGHYWWLPAYLLDSPDKEENWSVIVFSPNDPRFHYEGDFYGPISLPKVPVSYWEEQ